MTRYKEHPTFSAVRDQFDSYDADWACGDPIALRALYAHHRARLAADAAPVAVTPFETRTGLNGLAFAPVAPRAGAVLFFHGGSWMVGSPETHLVPCSHFAAQTGLTVASIDYRLAPEHPFPRQREDGVRAVAAAISGEIPGVAAPARLFLAGDSAGGAIAFWADAALDTRHRASIAGVLAFYGAFGGVLDAAVNRDPSPAVAAVAPSDGLSADDILAALARLGPLERLAADPSFSVLTSAPAEGAPCFIACGDADPLFAESCALAERLAEIGRATTFDVAEGLGHSYLHYVVRLPAAMAALERAAVWTKAQL